MTTRMAGTIGMSMMLWAAVASAALDPTVGGSSASIIARKQADAQRKAALDAAQRSLYYSQNYANEGGGDPDVQVVLHAQLAMLWWYQVAFNGAGEWGSILYRDKYGLYWFTMPYPGYLKADGSWYTPLYGWYILRPESTIVSSSHTHPWGIGDQTGAIVNDGDNLSDWPMFVIREDGGIFVFKPRSHDTKLYGVMEYGNVITKYKTWGEMLGDTDPYKIAQKTNTQSSPQEGGSVWVPAATFLGIAVGVIVLIAFSAGGDEYHTIATPIDNGGPFNHL